jgi:hypothetical protein
MSHNMIKLVYWMGTVMICNIMTFAADNHLVSFNLLAVLNSSGTGMICLLDGFYIRRSRHRQQGKKNTHTHRPPTFAHFCLLALLVLLCM